MSRTVAVSIVTFKKEGGKMDRTIFMVVTLTMDGPPKFDGIEYDKFDDALRTAHALWRDRNPNAVVVQLDPNDDFLHDWEVVYEVRSDVGSQRVLTVVPDLVIALLTAIDGLRSKRYERPRHHIVRKRKFESVKEMIEFEADERPFDFDQKRASSAATPAAHE